MILNNQIRRLYLNTIITVSFVLLSFTYMPSVSAVAVELCSPCYAGDGGQLRIGGNFYHGVRAQGASCTPAIGKPCWYISTSGQYWTSCYCGSVSDGGSPAVTGGGCGEPLSSETSKCSTFKPDWFNPLSCLTKNICTEFQDPDVRCGNTAAICDGEYSATCGTPCDAGCPGATQCGMCGNPACCTSSAPTTPVHTSPINGTTILTVGTTQPVTWNAPTNWGTDCNNAANSYAIGYRLVGAPSYTTGTSTTRVFNVPVAASCNNSYEWRVRAYNGSLWSSWSSPWSFIKSGFTSPTTTITSTSSAVSYPNTITFNATASDPDSNLSWIRLRIDRINGYGTGTTSMTNNIYNSGNVTCSGGSCSTSFNWSPTLAQSGYYYAAYALAADSCGYASALSVPYIFQVAPSYNLRVNVDRLGLVIPDGDGNIDFDAVCSDVTGDFSNVSVTYYAGGVSRATDVSDSSGIVTFNNISEADVLAGITLTASANNVDSCQSYDFYCYGENPNGMSNQVGHQVNFTGIAVGGTKEVTIGLGEEKKDSWETVFDGDIYARNANVGVSCVDATAGGGFETTTIVEDTIGGYFRTSGSLNSTATKDIYNGDNSGYAKDLDGLESNPGNQVSSLDAWFHNFEFPNMDSFTALSITAANFNSISGNSIYKINDNLTLTGGSYNLGSSDALSLVYVDGDLTFTGNLTSNNGLVIFIVNGTVTVSPSVGISNYTTAGTFTPATAANITAGILGLNDVTFASNGSGDNPVILNGFVMNRGDMYFNRDLLENNDIYPAHVIKFNTRLLAMLSDLEESLATGLATYDVQWIYDEN